MAERLTHKRRVRGGHRGSVKKMVSELEEFLASIEERDSLTVSARLNQLKRSMEEKLETITILDAEILALIEEEDELAREIEEADAFKASMYMALAMITEKLAVESSAGASPPAVTPRVSSSSSQAKLPKLTLRPFNGDVTQWLTFWDSFKSAVHENDAISDIDKFNYLRSLVERSAKEAISGLTLSSANYREAIAILQKRFGNKKQIINKHMDALLSVEAVTSQYNVKGLRRLYDQLETHIRGLKALGVDSESYGSLLSSVLVKKLPTEMQLLISRQLSSDDWTLVSLMETLVKEIEARERTAAANQPHGKTHREQPTSAALYTGDRVITCCYCQHNHSHNLCPKVTSPESRKQLLRKAGRCFVCLKRGHVSVACRSSIKCSKCGNRHHISICPRNDSDKHAQQPLEGKSSGTSSGLNPEAREFNTQSTATCLAENTALLTGNETIMLQTAQATVYNIREPEHRARVRIILDSGSQRSYVTDRVKTALRLASKGKRTMSIATFGSARGSCKTCEIVEIGMEVCDGSVLKLRLFVVPIICEPLSGKTAQLSLDHLDHLSSLNLADPFYGEEREIDILVGADYYWSLATGRIRRGYGGPIAMETRIGWVLSGPATLVYGQDDSATLITHTLQVSGLKSLDEQLRSFWEIESLGILEDDVVTVNDFERNISFHDGRYEVPLPWKVSQLELPDNYRLCYNRLMSLLHRLRRNPDIIREYDAVIKDQIDKGIVEIVSNPEQSETDNTHYLPHHAVLRQDKETTKLRIVYDASAKEDGFSLNDCLYTGPKFDQNILDILLRFRLYHTALIADVEKILRKILLIFKYFALQE
ncbi:PREDICTED: uncharacterized protein LOC105315219 [Amphimedon queenslandica]|uniref:DUF1758 domain-containing protein n=1 Tax=Amphimedon queenslandica TaxID=400682 RepID=A0AAN0IRQ2_AMPQE|nr:PREDICTED: uncharacterized protein LOC105315219 [Amphimedon queenslandica]|eukprot:XP_011408081.1 PREDICTED: uncharacterized protein LOC105315219 [Amphimedon queenslandica]